MKSTASIKRRKGSAADIPDRVVSLALSQARAQLNHAERNAAMILVSCTLGLRAGEIAKLLWKFVLDDNGKVGNVLRLPNEVAKWRSGADLPISKSLQTALDALYQAQSAEHPVAPKDQIFRSQKGAGLSRQSV